MSCFHVSDKQTVRFANDEENMRNYSIMFKIDF